MSIGVFEPRQITLSGQTREGWGTVVTSPDIMGRAEVAQLLGVLPGTVNTFRALSRPGGIYEKCPFPEPDGKFAGRPFWRADRADEIRQWDETRPRGRGGRPKSA